MRQNDFDEYRSFVFSMLYDPSYDVQAIFTEHVKLAEQFENPLLSDIIPHTNEKTLNRRLKIGYVSPDFRRHSVAYFIEPVLSSHNRDHFEIFCYYLISLEDEVTARIKRRTDHWKSIAEMKYDLAAELIRRDGIDILVDLAGHMYKSLLLFARKPAPVQVTWIGYPATTGFSTMDYKIVDNYTDPPGLTERFYSEKLLRMPECFLCYQPDRDSPEVSALPALTSGEITFGSFNKFAKVTPEVVTLWSTILRRIPNSLLILKSSSFADMNILQNVKGMFARHDIDSVKIDFLPFTASFSEHLKSYSHIDIGLDPFPYNGVTTTCEALWMGVPIITLEGNAHASRVGGSLLSSVGLRELIAQTSDEYISIAVNLARNLKKLRSLRGELRNMMRYSPLCDAKRFTGNLEICYRQIWEKWCKSV
jgi:protein O-GlcNAc transferase